MGQNGERMAFDPASNNGLVLSSRYIPEELLGELLCHVDPVTLLKAQLVCKRWKNIIQTYVWRKKAELVFGQSLQLLKELPWSVYYHICRGKFFNRNLIKNHSGKDGLKNSWKILKQGGDHWKIENPPVGVPPLPNEPIFVNNQNSFVTSYYTCTKSQEIDLIAEGFNPQLLDTFQPPIEVSEWYSCRWDCPAMYELLVLLENNDGQVIDRFQFDDRMDGDRQNEWFKVSHEFSNYGPGLRKIIFIHGGRDCLFWAGHYGSKMAGASVVFKVPLKLPTAKKSREVSSSKTLTLDDPAHDLDDFSDSSDIEVEYSTESSDRE